MNATQYYSWALDLLRRHHDVTRLGAANVVQFLIEFPLEEPVCWTVSKMWTDEADQSNYLVFRHVWDPSELSEDDYLNEEIRSEIASRPPTIRMDEFSIPAIEIDQLLEPIKNMTLPIVVPQEMPPHGACGIEVILGNVGCGVSFRWWGQGPSAWQPFVEVIARIAILLRKRFEKPE